MRLRTALAALVLLLPSVARANDAAEKLFREGRAAMTAGNFAAACPKFEESQRIEPAPGTLMNLADCEEHLGQIVQARNDFALAASGFPRDDPRRPFVLQHASDLEKRFAHLALRLAPGGPAGTTVRRANVIVDPASLGVAVDVDPGEQRVVVSAPGHVDRAYEVRLGEGESKELAVEVGALEPTKTIVKTLVYANHTSPKRVAGVVVGLAGLAAVGVGVGTGIVAMGDANDVRAHCNAIGICDERGAGAAAEGRVVAPLTTGLLIGGGGFVLAGVMLLWASAGHSSTTVTPMIGRDGGGIAVTGAF